MSDIWCQNRRCAEKKNQNQIRGTKGAKYYQSYKATGYYHYWCSMRCRDQWFSDNAETAIRAVGLIDKQTIPMEDAWFIDAKYNYNSDTDRDSYIYTLKNVLLGVKQAITREQAQTPEGIAEGYNWRVKSPEQAKELAIQLGLTKQVA